MATYWTPQKIAEYEASLRSLYKDNPRDLALALKNMNQAAAQPVDNMSPEMNRSANEALAYDPFGQYGSLPYQLPSGNGLQQQPAPVSAGDTGSSAPPYPVPLDRNRPVAPNRIPQPGSPPPAKPVSATGSSGTQETGFRGLDQPPAAPALSDAQQRAAAARARKANVRSTSAANRQATAARNQGVVNSAYNAATTPQYLGGVGGGAGGFGGTPQLTYTPPGNTNYGFGSTGGGSSSVSNPAPQSEKTTEWEQRLIDSLDRLGSQSAQGYLPEQTDQYGNPINPNSKQRAANILQNQGMSAELAKQYQDAFDAAEQANEDRYQQILGGREGLEDFVGRQVNNLGQTELSDTQRQYDRLRASGQQSLTNRGLGNTTIVDSVNRGIEEDRNRALARVNESVSRERLANLVPVRDATLNFMERRDDVGPDLNAMVQLQQALGQGSARQEVGVPTASLPQQTVPQVQVPQRQAGTLAPKTLVNPASTPTVPPSGPLLKTSPEYQAANAARKASLATDPLAQGRTAGPPISGGGAMPRDRYNMQAGTALRPSGVRNNTKPVRRAGISARAY